MANAIEYTCLYFALCMYLCFCIPYFVVRPIFVYFVVDFCFYVLPQLFLSRVWSDCLFHNKRNIKCNICWRADDKSGLFDSQCNTFRRCRVVRLQKGQQYVTEIIRNIQSPDALLSHPGFTGLPVLLIIPIILHRLIIAIRFVYTFNQSVKGQRKKKRNTD